MGSDARRAAILAAARARLGIPYALPPSPPATTDCSYWVGDVYAAAGLPIPHWLTGVRTAEQIRAAFVKIDFTDALPGDLVWFERTYDDTEPSAVGDGHVATHVGISLGAGTRRMLSAVEPVSKESDISTQYWQTRILSVGRHPALEAIVPVPDAFPLGIDVSSYQGAPDWAAVAASGVAFAWTKATESTTYINPTFARNWAQIKANGIYRGAYHFARPDTNNPEAEAEHFIGAVLARSLEIGDLLALDLEDGTGDLSSWTARFIQHVRLLVGFDPLVYTSPSFAAEHTLAARPEIGNVGLWLASWQDVMPVAPAPWNLTAFWQYTDSATVPGISGNVDGDRFNGTADRIPLYGKPDTAPPPVPPSPADTIRAQLAVIRAAADAIEAALA